MNTEAFRQILQSEYSRRRDGNPAYSMRAYARSLGLNVACLSVLLRGQRSMTVKMAERLARKLQLSPAEMLALKSPDIKKSSFELLTLDTFATISIWYHDAILELMRLKEFKSNPKWIARKLGLSEGEVVLALERLARLEFITFKKNRWVLVKGDTTVQVDDLTTQALHKLQLQVLKLSQNALESRPVSERYHSSLTMAIRKKDLSLAKQKLREFREQFSTDLQKASGLDDVFQLAISFYPITQMNPNGGNND